MNPIEVLKSILKEMDNNKKQYVVNPQKDFTRNRKVTFYDMMWFLLFIGANSMSEEIRKAFNNKDFSYISDAAILKSRSKIKILSFKQLFHKFNDTLEKAKKYKAYRVLAVDGSDFSSLYSADSEYATISNQYGGANRMHVNFAYDILNRNFLDCVIEAKNKADERKGAVKMLTTLAESEKILAIMDRGYDGLKVFEHCNRIPNLNYLIRIRSGMTKEIKSLPDKELDLDLKFEVSAQTKRLPYRMKIQAWDMKLPCIVSFRLVKVRLKDKWLVLATNLPRQEFSARRLKTLYEKRWKIELAFRDIKHALGALHFHSKKDLFNLQEFFAHLIRYNLTSRIICQIRLPKPKNLKYHYEVNFKNAAQIIQDYCRHAWDYEKILEQIKHYVHPLRGNRLFQRNCRYIYPVSFNYWVA
ncbi:MAG: IS4 family transposase [Selenomonadaceae bacterium]|nr:IS4 family transposase [Selenomonadaceae bacterium]